ncbi:CNDP dipeptidase [Conidiobolus coronatus NRRL 28638]|uniref:CNDP dipeptidase n=1 Tax=Conidiobolus coronatus (strain ATCC 28846 / CBS 209.66 / NRRL 28638) TaxID=796925 RepID=A0A137PB83_CONC2|nr:CNDP dipeptidase [Conidiobolus coronatus NRRL 28638]|eukprot:KXN72265.1 CNDP dipeptidase [Conidiobolus coronatus NRRL 28638]
MEAVYQYIDENQQNFIQKLREAVAIPSVSSSVPHRPEVIRMGEWLIKELEALGATTKRIELGDHELEGQTIPLPPVVLARYGEDPKKKTLLVYGHYDVQPALKEDGWNTDPFELVHDDKDRLVGRGATDDKGPVLGWLLALEAFQKTNTDFPVNLLCCFEGMEESGSEGLDDVVIQQANEWFKDTDCVCISDNYWLGTTKPCLTYGLRGVSYFSLVVKGPAVDLHSGLFGGTVHEPMTDLVHLMGKLVNPQGEILVPGIMDQVAPLTEEESQTYDALDFDMNVLHDSLGNTNSIHDSAKKTLMHRWRYPSLSLHGIEGAFYSPGAKTVIPAKVTGKFSIRTVPDMEPEKVTELVVKYVKDEFAKLGSKNEIDVFCQHAGKSWVSSFNHWNFQAAIKAVKQVFQVEPDLTREGGSIPVTLTFEQALGKNVLLLPMGSNDDGAHSTNEKIDRRNFIEGIKLLSTYMYELSQTTEA